MTSPETAHEISINFDSMLDSYPSMSFQFMATDKP